MILDLTIKINNDLIKPWLDQQENKHIATGHVGTHLDTYLKTEIPLAYFKRHGFLVDANSYAEEREIGVDDVNLDSIQEGDFVLFRTDRSNIEYGTPAYFTNHPQLSQALILALCERKISFIGIDASGIRRSAEHGPADKLCEEHGVYVIENLHNLAKIKNDDFEVYTLWFDDEKATGLPCRVLCVDNK